MMTSPPAPRTGPRLAKASAPSATAQTSCRKVTGCVTVTGAAAKASVMVKCPAVAKAATASNPSNCATRWAAPRRHRQKAQGKPYRQRQHPTTTLADTCPLIRLAIR